MVAAEMNVALNANAVELRAIIFLLNLSSLDAHAHGIRRFTFDRKV